MTWEKVSAAKHSHVVSNELLKTIESRVKDTARSLRKAQDEYLESMGVEVRHRHRHDPFNHEWDAYVAGSRVASFDSYEELVKAVRDSELEGHLPYTEYP